LPIETVLAVNVPNLGASIADFASMPLARMWAEQEVQTFLADAKTMAKQRIDGLLAQAKEMHKSGQLPVDPDKLMALRLNGGTFAITRLELGEANGMPHGNFGCVVHLDFGASAEQWFGLAKMGLGLLEQAAGAEMVRSEAKVGDVTMITLAPAHPDGSDMCLNVAMLKDGLLIGTLKDDVKQVLENAQKHEPVLIATEAYKTSAKHLITEGAEVEMFFRPEPMIEFGIGALGVAAKFQPKLAMIDIAGVGRAIDALGLRAIKSVGGTCTYQNGKCISKSYVVAPAPGRKGVTAGGNKTLDTAFLKWVPKDAVSFSGHTLDPLSIFDGIVGALRAYDPKVADMALGQLGEIEKKLGFTLRDDLFGSLGDTMVFWSMPMGAITSTPELAMLLKVKEQDKLVKVLKSLSALTHDAIAIEESEKRGVKAYSVHINFDPSGGHGVNPFDMFSPTFSFKDGWLVAGLSSSDIKRTFQRMDREDDPKGDIRGNKEFAAYADSVPKDVHSLSFTDWKAEFESYYQMLTGLLAFVPMSPDVPIDMSQLPEVGTLTKHLFGSISYSKSDANGFETTSTSPFGPEVLVLLLGAGAAGAGIYFAMRH
jgi:hypothetical protein